MPPPSHNTSPERRRASFSSPFGVPLGDLGLLTTLVMSVGLAFASFFLATFVAIVVLLATSSPQHTPDYALSYRHFGLPVGIIVGVLAFAYLGTLWAKRILRRT